MPIRKAFLLALFLFVILTMGWFLFFLKWRESIERHDPPPQEPVENLQSGAIIHPDWSDTDREPVAASLDLSTLGLQEAAADRNRRALQGLSRELASQPRDQAVERVLDWLASGADMETGMWFRLGPGGQLLEASTFRSFAFDQLARLDPQLAADMAESVFRSGQMPSTPDEFALLLRNLARLTELADSERVDLLEAQMRRLTGNTEWIAQPGIPFLESFDVWVGLESVDAVQNLHSWLGLGEQNPALEHAAYLTLERLIDRIPEQTLYALAHPNTANLPAASANYRAALWARTPLEKISGEHLVDAYLLNPATTSVERSAFFAQLPNLHFSHSHNLLSEAKVPDANTLLERLEATRHQLLVWHEDPRFAPDRPSIENAVQRLQGMLGAAYDPE